MKTNTNKKMGRPRLLSEESKTLIHLIMPEVRTERGKQNIFYRQLGIELCGSVKEGKFLFNTEEITKIGYTKWNPTILAEIGRLYYETRNEKYVLDIIKQLVGLMKKEQHTAKQWCELLRGVRLSLRNGFAK